MWCELWNGCEIEPAKELTIELTVTPSTHITMKDSRSGATGTTITVTRKNLDWPDSVAISHS